MSGLLISLKPNEKFLVNGALLSNGPKRGQICIVGDGVNVLRLSDVIHPDTVCTPVTRLYHALQTILSGDSAGDAACAEVEQRFHSLAYVFENTSMADKLARSREAWSQDRIYSALCRLKPLIAIEAELLGDAPVAAAPAVLSA